MPGPLAKKAFATAKQTQDALSAVVGVSLWPIALDWTGQAGGGMHVPFRPAVIDEC